MPEHFDEALSNEYDRGCPNEVLEPEFSRIGMMSPYSPQISPMICNLQ